MAATTNDPLAALATHALGFVRDGDVVGLGSGRAASAFVRALGARVRGGLRVRGVPTSEETARLARELGIDLVGLEADIALTIDGADEVDGKAGLEQAIRAIPGVVDTGLFLGTADRVVVADGDTIRELVRKER